MRLTTKQSRELFEKFGIYAKECCDKCGQVLGPVRYTRKDDTSEWCSRECRDGYTCHAPGTCKTCRASLAGLRRGTLFCSPTCRKRENRKSQSAPNSRDQQMKTKGLQNRLEVLAIPAHSGVSGTSVA